MLGKGWELEEQELSKTPMSEAQLDALIGERDVGEFLNAKNELYREKNMKEKPPGRAAALKLMSREVNLIRRPILVVGRKIYLGRDGIEKAERDA